MIFDFCLLSATPGHGVIELNFGNGVSSWIYSSLASVYSMSSHLTADQRLIKILTGGIKAICILNRVRSRDVIQFEINSASETVFRPVRFHASICRRLSSSRISKPANGARPSRFIRFPVSLASLVFVVIIPGRDE